MLKRFAVTLYQNPNFKLIVEVYSPFFVYIFCFSVKIIKMLPSQYLTLAYLPFPEISLKTPIQPVTGMGNEYGMQLQLEFGLDALQKYFPYG